MSTTSAALSLEKPKAYRAILWGGLIAGTLDILAAFINSGLRGVSPTRVLQSIASGLLGADSLILMFCVGLPIALAVRRYSK